jgi:hypothetical protein
MASAKVTPLRLLAAGLLVTGRAPPRILTDDWNLVTAGGVLK